MLIDIHTHTFIGSDCSILHPEDLIVTAKERGIEAVCITDHDTTRAVKICKELGRNYDFLVLGGMEVRCKEGDVLTFGLWTRPPGTITVQELIELVHDVGGVVIPAHPFRTEAPSLRDKIWEVRGFDAIEILNGNASDYQNELARDAALKLDLPGTGGSDAHSRLSIGQCLTFFEDRIRNEEELIVAIKERKFHTENNLGLWNPVSSSPR